MNKILTIPLILVLSSCSTNQIKTSDADLPQTAFISHQASPPKPELVTLEFPRQQKRHHSVVESGETPLLDSKNKENTDKAELAQKESWLPRIARYIKKGIASWYGPGFHGKKTATGEIFDMYEMTAAHKTLPIPSYAEVTNLANNKSVIVKINDRGPYVGNRLVDLSYAAAKKLGIKDTGTGKVEIKAISTLQALPQIQKTAASQNKKVYFQVGNFGSQRKALKLQDKIAANHLPESTIFASRQSKSTRYKVQMGPIQTSENAKKLSLELAKMGIKDPQIVTANRD